MQKFCFEKLLKNCELCKSIKSLDDEEKLEHLYKAFNKEFISFIKTFSFLVKIPTKEAISYFIDLDNINLDMDLVNKNLNDTGYITCQSFHDSTQCSRDCIFRNKIPNPFELGYKEIQSDNSVSAYPINNFPSLLRDYIKQLSEAMVAPPQYIGTALLALLSALCSRFAYLQATPTWKIPLTSYYLIVGDVSTKKTPTISEVLNLLNGYLSKDDRVFANDSTVEALEQLLLKYKSILLHADESGIMDTLGGYTKTKSASTSKILSLYTCKPYRVDRKGQEPIYIDEPKLSILAGIQPSVLTQSQNLMRTGMLQRFIIAYAERSKAYCGFSMSNVDKKIKHEISNLIFSLYECGQEDEKIKFTLSKGALNSLSLLQDELFIDIDNTNNNTLRDYYGKYKEHVLKIAGLFQIVQDIINGTENKEITKETFDMAIGVAEYYLCVSRNLFTEINADKPIDTEKGYRELLKRCKSGVFNPTYLNANGIGGCDARKREFTDCYIERLRQQNKCIEWLGHGSKGRKFILIKE